MALQKLLLLGATGYMGGTFLTSLLQDDDLRQKLDISALVRSEAQAAKLQELGVKPILFPGLEDSEFLSKTAESFDVVMQYASSTHTAAAAALVRGLGVRRSKTGSKVHFLHASGTTAISDQPISKSYAETRTFSDTEDIYSYEKYRESIESYPNRETDIAIVETGEACGVDTHIVMAPFVFGVGTGPFGGITMATKMFYAAAKQGRIVMIGQGSGVWQRVQVEDLADFYLLLLDRFVKGQDVPAGRRGILFCESGSYTGQSAGKLVANAAHELGLLPKPEVESLSLDEFAAAMVGGYTTIAELGFASNARNRAVIARELGWAPKRDGEWESTFRREFEVCILQDSQKETTV